MVTNAIPALVESDGRRRVRAGGLWAGETCGARCWGPSGTLLAQGRVPGHGGVTGVLVGRPLPRGGTPARESLSEKETVF